MRSLSPSIARSGASRDLRLRNLAVEAGQKQGMRVGRNVQGFRDAEALARDSPTMRLLCQGGPIHSGRS